MDFPDGPVVKNPPSNAGDVGLIPGRGTKIPYVAGQLSPCMQLLSPCTTSGHRNVESKRMKKIYIKQKLAPKVAVATLISNMIDLRVKKKKKKKGF